jgi:hypothetical protein
VGLESSRLLLKPNRNIGNPVPAPTDEHKSDAPTPRDTSDFVREPRQVATNPKILQLFPKSLPLSLATPFLPLKLPASGGVIPSCNLKILCDAQLSEFSYRLGTQRFFLVAILKISDTHSGNPLQKKSLENPEEGPCLSHRRGACVG